MATQLPYAEKQSLPHRMPFAADWRDTTQKPSPPPHHKVPSQTAS